jgi:hypothetical protein
MKLKIYPLKLVESMNLDVKVLAAKQNLSMQDWMVKAIAKEIEREQAV